MQPIIALLYDFDKTLCTKDMQEYGFIPALGMAADTFWDQVRELTDREEMDNILSYMFKMVEEAAKRHLRITRDTFRAMGRDIEFFPGVTGWFDRINRFGQGMGAKVEHYIVSSGIKEIIEGTAIAGYFERIYACEFMYGADGTILWPKVAVNYTAKTQFLFRINKGVLTIDSHSAERLNRFTPENDRRVPFRNMIYIGDGLTDVPCMKLVKNNGGQSIAVYNPQKGDGQASELLAADRVNYVVPADYTQDSRLEEIVKLIMKKIHAEAEMIAQQRHRTSGDNGRT